MKNTLYNKIRYTVLTAAGVMALSSCTDFLTITPTDKTVLEDFWKTKDDVDQMVTGAYKYMISGDVIYRAIVWGELRSGSVKKYASLSDNALDNVLNGDLKPTYGYNNWSAFYKVINTCNLVMAHAPEVMDIDPAFTEGDYQTARAQMLALRALSHFYLIRAFRDIPYVTKAYENTEDMTVEGQLPPATTLQMCIDDLLEARASIYRYGTFGDGDWRNVGYLSLDAVDAILADIYLWRASMTNNQYGDYQQVVNYTQNIIDSHNTYYSLYGNKYGVDNSEDNPYHLYGWDEMSASDNMFYQVFGEGNSLESVFELQFDGTNNSNDQLRYWYWMTSKTTTTPTLVATVSQSQVTSHGDRPKSNSLEYLYASTGDMRGLNFVFNATDAATTDYNIRKLVDNSSTVITPSTKNGISGTSRTYNWDNANFDQNLILYRITDVMLMKAEALTQLANDSDKTDPNLQEAYKLIKAVNDRSLEKTRMEKDSLQYNTYSATRNDMELLCLQERGRELAFEGKRWFDLMRHSYRHMTGVDATRTLYDIDPSGASYPTINQAAGNNICTAMAWASGSNIEVKTKNEAYLYWPILTSEIDKNPLLHQNPVWVETQSSDRN